MTSATESPYYILFSHSSLSNSNLGAPSTSLGHPIIEYHFANDSPLSLLPQTAEEHVIVMDYDTATGESPKVKSLSRNMVVSGLKVAEAPGAAADEDLPRNDRMYIVETTVLFQEKSPSEFSQGERQSPHAILAQYKQRNSVLRRALMYPEKPAQSPQAPVLLPVSPLRPEH